MLGDPTHCCDLFRDDRVQRCIHAGKILKHIKQNRTKINLRGKRRIFKITLRVEGGAEVQYMAQPDIKLVISCFSLSSDGSKFSFLNRTDSVET